MPSQLKVFLLISTVLVYLTLPSAEADSEIPCVKAWGAPSANNSLSQCYNIGDSAVLQMWIDFLTKRIGQIAAPFVLGLFTCLSCPFVFCARYCCQCCGGSKQRPDGCCCGSEQYDEMDEEQRQAQYGSGDLACAKYFTLFCLALAGASVALTYFGGIKFGKGINGIYEGCQRPAPSTYNPVNASQFDEIKDTLNNILVEYNSPKYKPYRDYFAMGSDGMSYSAIVPAVLVLLVVVCAFCHIQTCVPCCLNCLFFLLCLIYGLVGTIFLVIHLPLDLACGEVNAQLNKQPSIMQYYVIPTCESQGFLSNIQDKIDSQEASTAQQACNSIKQYCSPSWYPYNASVQFNCDYNAGNCTTFAGVQLFANTLSLKPGATETCGAAPGGPSNCTLENCANYCVDPSLKNQSMTAWLTIGDASRIIRSFNTVVRPWLNCNSLLDRLVQTAKPMCDNLPDGMFFMGVGCTLVVVTMMLTICVTFRGQKRWFSPPDGYVRKPGDQEMSTNINSGPGSYSPYAQGPYAYDGGRVNDNQL